VRISNSIFGATAQTTEAEPLLEIKRLWKSFDGHEVLRGVDLELGRGEAISLIGPSGSGKSTLLNCINLLEPYEAGKIRFDGRPIGYLEQNGRRTLLPERELNALRREIGIVFQQYNLFPHLTVIDNITVAPRHVLNLPRDEALARAEAQLAKVGLSHKRDAYPSELSGGQQQRVAIARSLAMGPKLMLLDEITSALDPSLVAEALLTIRMLADEGMSMIIVTHEMNFAREVADRVVVMSEGEIVESGPPSVIFGEPKMARTREITRATLAR
jgi:polar amino acid transport system ATP-binding protein